MSILYLILILAVVVGMTWWLGSWNIMLNLINFFIAALVASSFFEPLAGLFQSFNSSFKYLVDFIAIWTLFVLTFGLLRVATDFLTRYPMRMNIWVEYAMRTILSIWLACGIACFTFFTFHLAPFPPNQFEVMPNQKLFGFGPDQMWMAFIQSRSRGALAEAKNAAFLPEYNLQDHPEDVALNARVFDPHSVFALKHAAYRYALSQSETLRVVE